MNLVIIYAICRKYPRKETKTAAIMYVKTKNGKAGKDMKFKKNIARILSSAMAISALSGSAMITNAEEKVTLTIGIVQNTMTTDYDDNYMTKLIEEKTGYDIEFFFFPSDGTEAKQKFSMMAASGEKLPDILIMGMSDTEIYNYGSGGYFIPLNDYMENNADQWNEMMDNWATPEQKERILRDAHSFDGNIYAFPRFYCDPCDASALYMSVNKQWLDNLGLEVPTTTDELYTVLKAFKEQDANGNGDPNDEIPMIGHTGWMGNAVTYLMNSFLYYAYDGSFGNQYNLEDGQIYAPYVTEEFHDGLRYVRKLVEEGLLSDLSFSQGDAELKSIIQAPNDQDSIVGVLVGHPSPMFGAGIERVKEYVGIPSLAGPNGVEYAPFGYQNGSYNTYITCDCENPDAAFDFLDAMQDMDLSISMRFGEKDVNWRYVEEGESRYSGIGEEYKAVFDQNFNPDEPVPWTTENNIIWHDQALISIPPLLMGGLLKVPYPDPLHDYKLTDLCFNVFPERYNLHPDWAPVTIKFNEEETDAMNDTRTTIDSYVGESITRFALGELDVEADWDAYLAELDAMNLSGYLEVCQTAYERGLSQ